MPLLIAGVRSLPSIKNGTQFPLDGTNVVLRRYDLSAGDRGASPMNGVIYLVGLVVVVLAVLSLLGLR